MLYAPSNLQQLMIERKKVVLAGEKGHVELAVYDSSTISVFYSMDGAPSKVADGTRALLFSERFQDQQSARKEWESIVENEFDYELLFGPLMVRVVKANATVSVYRNGKLVHGGQIGDKDTVLSSFPLRVQRGASGQGLRGKFNFRMDRDDAFFGLGEKTGALNKRNRVFKLFNKDALGYNAELSDPLYKSVPFYVVLKRSSGASCGLFFPHLNVEEVNFGVESNYYYSVALNGGPFGYFLFAGDGYRDILRAYGEVVGLTALPPLFSFGYLGSSMGYTDPDDAEERVLDYFDKVEKRDIPCEGMYFSSGYARAESGERYTFVWNRKKFPNPAGYLGKLAKRGFRICCNVKPGILTTHPWYPELARQGIFIADETGNPYTSYYWGNTASLVDFNSEAGFKWWVDSLTENIIEAGSTGVWNDNNEFELEDEALPAQAYRAALPVLMAKASYEALRKAHPGKRPWLISRSGYAGIQRYARTWTGDNVADFHTLRFNVLMGLNLGLSGIPIYGHDIGGFFGAMPDAELLVRWCQSGVFQPRFVMHSWKPDGSVTEPWTYPETEEAIVALIRERYRFLPYLYNLAIAAFKTGAPIERPLALEFPQDSALPLDSGDRMAGDSILVFATPERGESAIRTRLPAGADWYDPVHETVHRGGRELTIEYPLWGARYMVRCGSIVPVNEGKASLADGYFSDLCFVLYPPAKGSGGIPNGAAAETEYIEDDGESDFVEGSHNSYRVALTSSSATSFACSLVPGARAANPPKRRRTFRFRVPSGFSIMDAAGKSYGSEYRVEFSGSCGAVEFNVSGEWK